MATALAPTKATPDALESNLLSILQDTPQNYVTSTG